MALKYNLHLVELMAEWEWGMSTLISCLFICILKKFSFYFNKTCSDPQNVKYQNVCHFTGLVGKQIHI